MANTQSPHGTHVAGTAVGSGVLSGGKYKGVAPGASLYLYKIGNDTDARASYADMIEAINRAASQGVDVFSMSYGGISTYMDGSESVEQAIDAAVAGGMTVFISAGNDADASLHDSMSVAPGAFLPSFGFSLTNPSSSSAYTTAVDFRVIWRDGTPADANITLACSNLGGGETLTQTFSSWSSRGTDGKIYRLIPNLTAAQTKTYLFTLQNTAASGTTPLVHLYRISSIGAFTSPDNGYTVSTRRARRQRHRGGGLDPAENVDANFLGGSWQYSSLTVGTLAPFSSGDRASTE